MSDWTETIGLSLQSALAFPIPIQARWASCPHSVFAKYCFSDVKKSHSRNLTLVLGSVGFAPCPLYDSPYLNSRCLKSWICIRPLIY